jgi:hypothetical protein
MIAGIFGIEFVVNCVCNGEHGSVYIVVVMLFIEFAVAELP